MAKEEIEIKHASNFEVVVTALNVLRQSLPIRPRNVDAYEHLGFEKVGLNKNATLNIFRAQEIFSDYGKSGRRDMEVLIGALRSNLMSAHKPSHVRFVRPLADVLFDVVADAYLYYFCSVGESKKKLGLDVFLTDLSDAFNKRLSKYTPADIDPFDDKPSKHMMLNGGNLDYEVFHQKGRMWKLERCHERQRFKVNGLRYGAKDGLIVQMTEEVKIGENSDNYERKLTLCKGNENLRILARRAFWDAFSTMSYEEAREEFLQDCVFNNVQFSVKKAMDEYRGIEEANEHKRPVFKKQPDSLSDEQRIAQIRKEIPNFGKYA